MHPLLPPVTPRLSRGGRSDASPGGSRGSDGPDSSVSPRKQRRVPQTCAAPRVPEENAVLEESPGKARLRSPSPNRQSKLKVVLQNLESEMKHLGLKAGSPPSAQSFRLHCEALGQLAELLPSYKSFLDAIRAQSEGYAAGLQVLAAESSKAKSRAKALKAKLDNVEAQTLLFPCEQQWLLVSNLHRQLDAALSDKEQSDARLQRSQKCQERLEAELQATRQENQAMQAALDEARSDREQMQELWNSDKAKLKQLRAKKQQLQDECSQLQEQVGRTQGFSQKSRLTSADTHCSSDNQAEMKRNHPDLNRTIKSDAEAPWPEQNPDERNALEEALQEAEEVLEPEKDDDQKRQPHFWGVTVGQVKQLYDDIGADLEAYCRAHKMYFKEGRCVHVCTDCSAGPCKFEHKDVQHISMEQLSESEQADVKTLKANMHLVVPRHVKPQTKDLECSWSELKNPKGLQIQVFITHTWSQEFKAFVNTLSQACDSKEAVWVCSLAIPQNGDVKGILNDDNIERSPFAMALKFAEKFLVILDEDLDVPDRAWCTFEIERAGRWGKPTLLWPHDVGDLPRLQKKMETLDMAQAKASDADDLRRIQKSIRESGGFEVLNRRLRTLVNDRVRLFLESRKAAESLVQQRDLQLQEMIQVDKTVRMGLKMQVEGHRKRVKELEEKLSRATNPDEQQKIHRQLSELFSQVNQDKQEIDMQHLIEEKRMLENKLEAQKDKVVNLLQQRISIQFRQKKTPKIFLLKTCRALQTLSGKMINCDCPRNMKNAFDSEFQHEVDLSLKDMASYLHDSLESKLNTLPIVRSIFSRVLGSQVQLSESDEEESFTGQEHGLVHARDEIHRLIESQDLRGLTGRLSLLQSKSMASISSFEDDLDVSDLVESVLEDRKVMEMADVALGESHRRLVQSKWSKAALSAKFERATNDKLVAERHVDELQREHDEQNKQWEEALRRKDKERGELQKQLSSARVSSPGNSPSHGSNSEAMQNLRMRLEEEAERANELAKAKNELETEYCKLQASSKTMKRRYQVMAVSYSVSQNQLEVLRQTRPGLENFVPKTAMQLLFGALHSTYQDEVQYGRPQWPQKIKEQVLKQLNENVTIDLLGHLHAFFVEALRKGPSRELVHSLPLFLPDQLTNPDLTHAPPQVVHRKSAPPVFRDSVSPSSPTSQISPTHMDFDIDDHT